ncbi:MAG: hypothetical protein JWN10_499 [Solirubrobacterales bacterium]|nr:hypothetical protein [Solirubrobacterales bacterium]
MKTRIRGGLGLAFGVYALTAVAAAAAPRLTPVTTHMPSGVTPAYVEIEPDGTAYVEGDSLSKEVLLPEVYVYNPAGRLKGSTFVARLSLSGIILEKLGSIPIYNAANFWEYDAVEVAGNGDGRAIRSVPGRLYRFHA